MQLLVSVANAEEAAAAVAGGADIIDAKDPAAGPLGAVAIDVLRQIDAAAGGARLLTAALGDAADEDAVEHAARDSAAAGARLVKVGFAGITAPARAAALLDATRRGANAGSNGRCGVVAVAYADADQVASLRPDDLVSAAAIAGTSGVLLDTAKKDGPGLPALFSPDALSAWVERAHQRGLMVALAGRLRIEDLEFVCAAGADIAGVRGAACEGSRTGRVTAERVRLLRRALTERHDAD